MNKIKKELNCVFKYLKEEKINYFFLRDYQNVNNKYLTADIDLYLSPSDYYSVKKFLISQKWKIKAVNNDKYPHRQFFKFIDGKIYKLDFVTGLFYGKHNYYLNNKKNLSMNYKLYKNMNIPNEKLSLIMILAHIIFDKGFISQKNFDFLKFVYEEYCNQKKLASSDSLDEISKDILLTKNLNQINQKICIYRKKILGDRYLLHNFNSEILRFKVILKKAVYKIYRSITNNSIAFIGVDGSGKSTSIEHLFGVLPNSRIVYMGLKKYKIKLIEKLEFKNNFFIKIFKRILLYAEMVFRILEYRFTDKIVIYDRYVDDIFINSVGIQNIFDKIFYKFLFPKPKIKYYFYCDVEKSIDRKKDITDEKTFRNMKKKYDNYFNLNNAYCISTNDDNIRKSLHVVCDYLNDKFQIM